MDRIFPGKKNKKDVIVHSDNQPIYLRDDYIKQCIVDTDFRLLSRLPPVIDINEWLATGTVAFVGHLNVLCGALSEYCSSSTCPNMLVPGNVAVYWIDDKGKKSKCSAVQYTDYALSFSQRCCQDESLFPTKYGKTFPESFLSTQRKIYRLLLHILAHIYHCHYCHLVLLELNGHLNTMTYHFFVFVKTFQLIDDKDLLVLVDLFNKLHHFFTDRRDELTIVSCCHFLDNDNNADRTKKKDEKETNKADEKENLTNWH